MCCNGLFSTIIGGVISLFGSIVGIILTYHLTVKSERKLKLTEKKLQVLSEAYGTLLALINFVGEGSEPTKDIDSVHPDSDENAWNIYVNQWKSLEPQMWVLKKEIREKIYSIYSEISNGSHDTQFDSVLDELSNEMEELRKKYEKGTV